jgi:adenylate cyclase
VAARHDVRLALSDTLRIGAEDIGARLKTGSLAGPVETQIRGRSGSLTVWLWRGEQAAVNQRAHPDAAE